MRILKSAYLTISLNVFLNIKNNVEFRIYIISFTDIHNQLYGYPYFEFRVSLEGLILIILIGYPLFE